MARVPSTLALQEAFPQSDLFDLETFRKHAKAGSRHKAQHAADKAIQGHGVESIRCPSRGLMAVYVNTGDTYSATLLCNISTGAWRITTWGDYVEAFERRHGRKAFESLMTW